MEIRPFGEKVFLATTDIEKKKEGVINFSIYIPRNYGQSSSNYFYRYNWVLGPRPKQIEGILDNHSTYASIGYLSCT